MTKHLISYWKFQSVSIYIVNVLSIIDCLLTSATVCHSKLCNSHVNDRFFGFAKNKEKNLESVTCPVWILFVLLSVALSFCL